MGYIKHHAIVVTSGNGEALQSAYDRAIRIGLTCSEVIESKMNGYSTFLIAPDGSKEGWDESNTGDDRRSDWVAFAKTLRYSDGSSALEWCEVSYGSDDRKAKVERSEWRKT